MPRKMLVADLLCGAGGSSTGCARALAELGLQMELVCVNHWPVAIATHEKNHPDARHYVQDIATVRPHLLVPEGYLDLLMASPTCTHHSVARGGKPTSDQQRSDPWHIITWLTELRVKRIIIENVWEFTGWGPVDPRTGKPIPSRKGEYFNAWIDTIRRLGFQPEWHKLNAADYGDATTRQRFILMARSDRRPVAWPVATHAKRGVAEREGKLPWRPARDIIDWSRKGQSIFTRKKKLAPKTLARIEAGLIKFNWPEPYLVKLRNHMAGRPLGEGMAPVPAGVLALGGAEPIVLSPHSSGAPRSSGEPLFTITTGGAGVDERPGCARHIVVESFVLSRQSEGAPRSVRQPMPTQATVHSPVLVEPFILNRHGEGYGETRAHGTGDPAPTSSCRGAGYLVEPIIVTVAHGNSEGDATADSRRAHDIRGPLGAVHGTGVTQALIAPYYGSGSGETCGSAEEPLGTIPTRDRFGLVVPVTQSGGGATPRNVETDPLATMTTAKGGEFAIAVADQYDILFRMLEPDELAAAMGFTTEEAAYEFAGTKTEQVKQVGNAVSVRKMKACVSALMADAAPVRRRRLSEIAAALREAA